jgi:uncharacterized protein
MIKRTEILGRIRAALKRSRIVALLGPRQSGKTTLARQLAAEKPGTFFDLEDPASLAQLHAPMTALRPLKGLVILDEIQRRQDLFPLLRVLADRRPLPARFLILGSASLALLKQASESLAGRLETIAVTGFSLPEVGIKALEKHWIRGGFPLSFLAKTEEASFLWRKGFTQAVVERDLGLLGMRIPSSAMLRFWAMLAHYHGQIWNAADPARALGIGETTVRRYLDVLTDLYLVRQLQPWHANLAKRQVKAPKIYFRDSGLLHQLLGLRDQSQVLSHPKHGASWEGYAMEEVLRRARPDEAYFWATHSGAELDLLLLKNGKKYGVECKHVDAPKMTPSLAISLKDLKLEKITVIYPGERSYQLAERVHAVPFTSMLQAKKFSY